MRYFIKTFGCQMNEHDSEIVAGILSSAGYTPTEEAADADIVIINTCCIRESAENKIWGYIGNLKALKYQKPGIILAALGCMMQQKNLAELLHRQGRHLDIVLGTYQQHRLPEYISRVLAGKRPIIDISEDNRDFPDVLPSCRASQFTAQVNISYGCNNFCSYCIVPYVRGRERSRAMPAIMDELRQLAAAGVKEVMLLGQNVNSYGKDWQRAGDSKAPDFAALLQAASDIEGLERIRYMSSHPRDFTPALADTIGGLPKVNAYCHLPLQSGCDKILQAMNRGYTTADYAAILGRIRQNTPQVVITTDLIVGFPGESEANFQQTLAFVAECRFDAAYTFIYSPRSGTPAAAKAEQVPLAVKKERLQKLQTLQNQISLELNQAYLGRKVQVLVEGLSKNNADFYTGRTAGNKIVIFPGQPEQVGQMVKFTITGAKTWHLEAF